MASIRNITVGVVLRTEAQIKAEARAEVVAELRLLAAARKDYCHRCPEHQGDMAAMSPTDLGVHDNHATAEWLADIIEGTNAGHGWLPSWRWDEWPNTRTPL
jgi:hypothetical protein